MKFLYNKTQNKADNNAHFNGPACGGQAIWQIWYQIHSIAHNEIRFMPICITI